MLPIYLLITKITTILFIGHISVYNVHLGFLQTKTFSIDNDIANLCLAQKHHKLTLLKITLQRNMFYDQGNEIMSSLFTDANL